MNGQWIGRYEGPDPGAIVLNIDEVESTYRGTATLFPDNAGLPTTIVFFETPDKSERFTLRTGNISVVHPNLGTFHTWDDLRRRDDIQTIKLYQNADVSKYVDVNGQWSAGAFSADWIDNNGVRSKTHIPRLTASNDSELEAKRMNWSEFKAYASSLINKKLLFRGQNKPWRLRTSYHRRGRSDLFRYAGEDIPTLYRHLSARTKHVFNLENPDQNGAFYNLIQHHGYPTPLLDWTYSPYVAGFFAFRGIYGQEVIEQKERYVRVHIFDQSLWKANYPQYMKVLHAHLHLSVCEFIAIDNERMVPQQGVSTVTNVDDLEAYLKRCEDERKRKFLWAVDIPITERDHVQRELSHMGISAASLFPGLDGTCEDFAGRNFSL